MIDIIREHQQANIPVERTRQVAQQMEKALGQNTVIPRETLDRVAIPGTTVEEHNKEVQEALVVQQGDAVGNSEEITSIAAVWLADGHEVSERQSRYRVNQLTHAALDIHLAFLQC